MSEDDHRRSSMSSPIVHTSRGQEDIEREQEQKAKTLARAAEKRAKAHPRKVSPTEVVKSLRVLDWNRELRAENDRLKSAMAVLRAAARVAFVHFSQLDLDGRDTIAVLTQLDQALAQPEVAHVV